MYKKLLLTGLLLTSGNAIDFDKLSVKQQTILNYAYMQGKEYGFGHTLVAIAWIESEAGKYQININSLSSYDCGIFQANVKSVLRRDKAIKTSHFTKKAVCTRLIEDIDFAITEALAELTYWEVVRKGNYKKLIASYNAGWKWKNGIAYFNKLKKELPSITIYYKE